ncbi:MAG TPA: Cof-type HAD-IIB family hydrolase [Bacillales bacterium]|nr:Cof-type HAD-IIB family hydrolase [Bacillales bacterium]
MGKNIVFFDLDGTLLNDEKQIVPSAKAAVKQLMADGVIVAIATGRAPFMFSHFRRELGVDTYVSFNGQYVVSGDTVVYKNPLPQEEIVALDDAAGANGHPMVFLDHLEMKANQADHHYIRESIGDLKFPYPDVDRDFYRNREIFQALLFCPDPEEHQYKTGDGIEFVRWHDLSLDVIPAGGSKAGGIDRLLHHFGIRRENAYAFGDALNDIQMLNYVGTGVAMGNADPAAKKAADFVTKKASEDGIVHGLRELKLLP